MKEFLKQIVVDFKKKECLHLATDISFCALLSLIPMMMIGVSVTGYFLGGTGDVYTQLIASVIGFLPQGKNEIVKNLENIVSNWPQLGLWGFGILLFIATLLFGSIEKALNKIFSTEKSRNFFHSRLLAIGLIALFSIFFFLPTLVNFLNVTLGRFNFSFPLGAWFQGNIYRGFFAYVAYGVIVVVVPNHKVRLRYALLGGALFMLGAILVRRFLSWYLLYAFSQYNVIYGSLTALILLIVWIYYLSVIFLISSLLVASLQKQH